MLILSQGLLSVSCSVSEELHKKLGGRKARTAHLSWPKRYATVQHVMPMYKLRELPGRGLNIALGWAGYCSEGSEQFVSGFVTLSPSSFHYHSINFYYNTILFQSLNCSYLNPQSLSFPSDSLLQCWGMSGEARGTWWYPVPGWG